jgi:hypothetical protein
MGHPSGCAFATLFGLAPCGVLPATGVTAGAVRSYRTFSPLPFDSPLSWLAQGGMFSVPLSVRLPCPGVTRRTALWSSDFPPLDSALRASLGAIVSPTATLHYQVLKPKSQIQINPDEPQRHGDSEEIGFWYLGFGFWNLELGIYPSISCLIPYCSSFL